MPTVVSSPFAATIPEIWSAMAKPSRSFPATAIDLSDRLNSAVTYWAEHALRGAIADRRLDALADHAKHEDLKERIAEARCCVVSVQRDAVIRRVLLDQLARWTRLGLGLDPIRTKQNEFRSAHVALACLHKYEGNCEHLNNMIRAIASSMAAELVRGTTPVDDISADWHVKV